MRFLMFFLGEFANVWVLAALSVTLFLGGWQIPWGTQTDGITPATWLVDGSGFVLAAMMIGAALPAIGIAIAIFKYRTRAHAAIDRAQVPGGFRKLVRLSLHGTVDGAMVGHALGGIALIGIAFWQLGVADPTWLAARQAIAINGLQLGIFVAKALGLVFVVIQLRWTLPRLRVDQMMTLCWKFLVPISFACVVGVLVLELVYHSVPALEYAVRWAMLGGGVYVLFLYVKKIRAVYAVDRENYQNLTGEPAFYPPWRLP
jgi:hypothetical protein